MNQEIDAGSKDHRLTHAGCERILFQA
jgi:hypothetical protein